MLIAMVVSIYGLPAPAADIERRCWSMGAWLQVTVEAHDRSSALAAAEAAVRAVEAAEHRLSTWRDDSELSRLNASTPGAWASLSPELAHDLLRAVECSRLTDGAFNPGVAALVRSWDLRGQGRIPADDELTDAVAQSSLEAFDLRATKARRLSPGFGIEEGGFGKGVALRDGGAAALESGADCVRFDFGGQTYVAGGCGRTTVGIAHPNDRETSIARLSVEEVSIATSGNSERGITVNGERLGHVLDPSTGWPANDFGSVTVVTRDPVSADCVATALYAMGPRDGARWLRDNEGIAAVFAVVAGDRVEVLASEDLLEGLSVEQPSVTVYPLQRADRYVTAEVESLSQPAK
jgi:thiamine biosynthesis lipoprotein